MDVIRRRRHSNLRHFTRPVAVVALLGVTSYCVLFVLRPHVTEPAIERAAIVTDFAVRGDLIRTVRAPGTFVAERVQVAAASADGTIDSIPVRVGTNVGAGTIIATMTDLDLDAAVIDAQAEIVAARAELRSVQAQARASQLDRSATVSAATADYAQVREQAQRYAGLHAQGLVSDYDFTVARIRAGEARDAVDFDRRKIAVDAADAEAKISGATARVAQLTAALRAKEARRAALIVRAGATGVVQNITVERGARITAGTQLARIVGEHDLKVTLAVPEADMRDIVAALPATIDTQNGIARGHVTRVDPAAQNGSIAVDLAVDGTLPANARPDLHVDGTIEIQRLHGVVSIARPANAADNSVVTVFVLAEGGRRAVRVRAHLGRGTLERVQVLSGIAPGATVIISDSSGFPDAPTLAVQ